MDWRPYRTANCLVLAPKGDLDTAARQAVRSELAAFAIDEPRAIIVAVDDLRIGSGDALAAFASPGQRITGWPAVPVRLVARDPALRATLAAARVEPVHASLAGAIADLGDAPQRRRAEIELSPVAASSRRARAFVHETCQNWNLTDHEPDAITVTAELVENSIVHAGTRLCVRLEPHGSGLVVAVRDGSLAAVPRERDGRPGGLRVVAHLAVDWGWTPDSAGGKVVWAVLAG